MSHEAHLSPEAALSRISGSSEMARLIREKDWSKTPLGPIETWPEILVLSVNFLLASPFTFALYWGDEQTILYNDQYGPLLDGKHPSALGLTAREVWAEAWDAISPPINAAYTEGRSTTAYETLIPIVTDGTLKDRWFTYGFHPIYDGGRIVGVANPGQDNTAAVMARKRLEENEAKLTAAADAAQLGVYTWYPDADTVTWDNDHIFHTLGIPRSQAPTNARQFLERRICPEFKQGFAETLNSALLSMDSFQFQCKVRMFDGPARWLAFTGKMEAAAEGLPQRMIGTVQDITASHQVSDALSASDAGLRMAAEMAALGYTRLDIATQTLFDSSPRYLANFGRTPNEKFTYADLLAGMHPDDRPVIKAAMQKAVDEDVLYRSEYRFTWPDGSLHWIQARGRLLHLEDGSPLQMLGVTLDITERRLAENALLQNEKLAAVGRLAASIAHEINNPLESVTNLLYIARNSADLKEIHTYLSLADEELRRVAVIANQTLGFHKQSSKPRDITCLDLFSSVLNMYQAKLRNSGIHVEKRKRANKPVMIYEGDIRQVLANVIGNAIDAMPSGGRLLVRSRESENRRTGAKGLRLTVADTGTGIPKKKQAKIFEAFYTTKGIGGTGLGLWISSDIMHRHGGQINIRSSEREGHRGTVITLFLPFNNPAVATT